MNSLLNQNISGDSYEIILVDDGSTDNSLELAKDYINALVNHPFWPNIRIFSHPNKGLAGARNTGVDAATGKYLCFVDADDYIEENSLAALLQQMEEEQLDMLRFNYQKIDEEGKLIADSDMEASFDYSSRIMTGKEFLEKRLTTTCYVWAYIYRLDIIKKNNIRFVEGCYFDDTPWLPHVLQKAEYINCTKVRHQYYLQRSGSLVHTIDRKAALRKVQGQLELMKTLKEQYSQSDVQLQSWYKMMLSHTCVSMLTTISVYDYENRAKYLKDIQPYLPLTKLRSSKNVRNKIKLLNLSPRLFLWLVHVKNK